MNLTTEYLIIVEKAVSQALFHLCDDADAFDKLLQAQPQITIEDGQIRYEQKLACTYQVSMNEVQGKEQRFIHLKLILDGQEQEIEDYTRLLRSIRTTVHEAGGVPQTLWDDVSLHYSLQAYPRIHAVENLLRKLIAYFMLTNVGKDWVAEASPSAFQEALDKSKRSQYIDVLHQVDFKHLGDFLFRPYRTKNDSELHDMIDSAQKIGDLNLDELKSFASRSNWDRYFSSIVECEGEYLKKRWEMLYDLRCMVAHNALLTKTDQERIVQLTGELEKYLRKGIDNLDKVHVPEADKDQVAESVVSNISSLYAEAMQLWGAFETALVGVLDDAGKADSLSPAVLRSPGQVLVELHKEGLIDDYLLQEGRILITFRNGWVHGIDVAPSEEAVRTWAARVNRFLRSFRRTWRAEIADALVALGGEADLQEIYDHIERTTFRELPKSWRDAIRYTLQLQCSETETYKGGEDLFVHIGKGRWGLRDMQK